MSALALLDAGRAAHRAALGPELQPAALALSDLALLGIEARRDRIAGSARHTGQISRAAA
jgi:hypothetical protein